MTSTYSTSSQEASVDFSLEEFNEWYAPFKKDRLEPARQAAERLLLELFKSHLDDNELRRITVTEGRVKDDVRAYRRLRDKAGQNGLAKPEESPQVLRDLVGLRVICTNLFDVERVTALLENLSSPDEDENPSAGLTCSHDSSKNYIANPKDSGYRSVHFDLYVPVPTVDGIDTIRCELQVRTLLQDSWGELTHEDTYKPGSSPPPLIHTISKRMADIMATLDDLAQDLRNEMILEVEREVSDKPEEAVQVTSAEAQEQASLARAFLVSRCENLEAPISLAELAAETRREFGIDLSSGWFGYGTFLKLVNEALPLNRLDRSGPGYVLPAGASSEEFDLGPRSEEESLPAFVRMRSVDRSFPILSPEKWTQLFAAISEATEIVATQHKPPFNMTFLSKIARDQTETGKREDVQLGRNALNYVARCVLFSNDLTTSMSPTDVANTFVDSQVPRFRRLGVSQAEIDEAEAWVRGYYEEVEDGPGV